VGAAIEIFAGNILLIFYDFGKIDQQASNNSLVMNKQTKY
jgi:hypothetical protein